jgi:hypothetical protein
MRMVDVLGSTFMDEEAEALTEFYKTKELKVYD